MQNQNQYNIGCEIINNQHITNMIDIIINDIEQVRLNTLNNEQLCQLRNVLE